ncbi:hypothetical protein OE88DRAFT_372969 [Heliocybe sulcata]|uniref:Ion transport domain-containing protein n=1 Tax=Heliocybe sulcata TaxID=5364 RepID=A0A5C3MW46_9AGAM|nr:hypothetical protein OE88DRAFT_372969 [Heliocybe sulcata]
MSPRFSTLPGEEMSAEEHNALLAVPMAADVESCSDESAIHCAPPGEVGASQCETCVLIPFLPILVLLNIVYRSSFPSSPGSPKYPPPYFFLYALQFSLGIPAVILAIVQSVNWYAGLELYLLNCMVDSVIIAEVGIKLLVMGDDFWTTAWNVLDLFVAFLCAMSLPAMFLSRVGALRNMLAGSAVGAFDRPLRDLLNQACYPGAYALLYLAMASLSTAAFGMGVSWWWQDLAFNIVGIIVNSLVLCEVGLRLLVLRTRFSHSVWNCLDVSICVFSIVGVSRCFQSPIEMDIACFFILLRSALQLVRISVLMRR